MGPWSFVRDDVLGSRFGFRRSLDKRSYVPFIDGLRAVCLGQFGLGFLCLEAWTIGLSRHVGTSSRLVGYRLRGFARVDLWGIAFPGLVGVGTATGFVP